MERFEQGVERDQRDDTEDHDAHREHGRAAPDASPEARPVEERGEPEHDERGPGEDPQPDEHGSHIAHVAAFALVEDR